MSKTDLMTQIRDLKKQITTIELDKYTKPMKNVRAITALRLKVAMMKTRMNDQAALAVAKEK